MCEIALQVDLNYLNNSTSLNTFREDSPDTDLQSSNHPNHRQIHQQQKSGRQLRKQ